MNTPEVKAFLVILPTRGGYGFGDTLREATTNALDFGGRGGSKKPLPAQVVMFSCSREAVTVRADMSLTWMAPAGTVALTYRTEV